MSGNKEPGISGSGNAIFGGLGLGVIGLCLIPANAAIGFSVVAFGGLCLIGGIIRKTRGRD